MTPTDTDALIKALANKLPSHYEVLEFIASGSYGQVFLAENHLTQQLVVIKAIKDITKSEGNKRSFLREIKLLRALKGHPNIVALLDIIAPETDIVPDEVFLVFETCESDLKNIIDHDIPIDNDQVPTLIYQLLCALQFMHKAHILHRDIKPANILLDSNLTIKLADFSLARAVAIAEHVKTAMKSKTTHTNRLQSSYIELQILIQNDNVLSSDSGEFLPPPPPLLRDLTKHVTTRWYRSPELITLSSRYDEAVDLWGVGCIMAEILLLQKSADASKNKKAMPLFPGHGCYGLSKETEFNKPGNQLELIYNLLGTPTAEEQKTMDNIAYKEYVSKLPVTPAKDLQTEFPNASPQAIDLLSRLLTLDPGKRITAEEALNHPWFANVQTSVRHLPYPLAPADQTFLQEYYKTEQKDSDIIDLDNSICNELADYSKVITAALSAPLTPISESKPSQPDDNDVDATSQRATLSLSRSSSYSFFAGDDDNEQKDTGDFVAIDIDFIENLQSQSPDASRQSRHMP